MNHLSEEQLILHYYGEEGDTLAVEGHLEECDGCRSAYCALQRVLNVVDSLPVPTRSAEYGAQVWKRIEPKLPVRRKWWTMPTPMRWAAAATVAATLLIAAFVAGRYFSPARRPAVMTASDTQAGERVLMIAVGDYLERSQMVLIELSNANPSRSMDITSEQERAEDLISESRLYRQTAARTGQTAVASVLDDLDRVLLEIAHAPSRISPEQLEGLRQRLEAEGILFKIRVLNSNVRNQEEPSASSARQRL